jgi:uncharacterized membrane protein YphA (DoxX/SURF4 family)
MSEENQFSQPPPGDEGKTFPKILWLFVALFPSALAFVCFRFTRVDSTVPAVLAVVDLVCSVAAGIGLARGIKSAAAKAFLAFVLCVFFFILNAIIVLLLGCTGAWRGAP